jgi:hypothetical protein
MLAALYSDSSRTAEQQLHESRRKYGALVRTRQRLIRNSSDALSYACRRQCPAGASPTPQTRCASIRCLFQFALFRQSLEGSPRGFPT